jgi:hypothetical protein
MGKASNRKKTRRQLIRGFKLWDPDEYTAGVDWGFGDSNSEIVLRTGTSTGKTTVITDPWAQAVLRKLRQSGKTEMTNQAISRAMRLFKNRTDNSK